MLSKLSVAFVAASLLFPAASAIAQWKIEFRESGSSPVIADGVLYVGSADGAVYALDAGTGETKWRFKTGEGLPSEAPVITAGGNPMAAGLAAAEKLREKGISRVDMTPAIESGTVFIGSGDRSFYAIDAVTGKQKWSYLAGPGMASGNFTSLTKPAAVLKDGSVYFTTEIGLHALDSATGKEKWVFETLQEVPKQKSILMPRKRDAEGPVVGDGVLFLTAWPYIQGNTPLKSYLYAVDPESGKAKWVVSVDGLRITAPATAKGLALFAVEEKLSIAGPVDRATLYAIDAADGQIKWKFSAEKQSNPRPPLVADNTIYFPTEKILIALEMETGRQLWSFSEDVISAIRKTDDQHLYVVTRSGTLSRPKGAIHALALTTGQKKWSRSLDESAGNVMIHQGVVYAGREHLYAIDASTGKELRSFSRTSRESVRLISADRIFLTSPTTTYVGSSRVDQGYLYAIDARR